MAEEKANYEPSSQQRDLEARLGSGNASDRVLSTADVVPKEIEADPNARSFAVEGNDLTNYRNVDPIYMTYANDTEAPLPAEEGIEKDLEEQIVRRQANVTDEEVSSDQWDENGHVGVEDDEPVKTLTDPDEAIRLGQTTDLSAKVRLQYAVEQEADTDSDGQADNAETSVKAPPKTEKKSQPKSQTNTNE